MSLDHPNAPDYILLAAAEPATLKAAFELLQLEGFRVLGCTNVKCARCILAAVGPEIAVLDYHLPDGDAGRFLEAAKRAHPRLKCVVLTDAAHFDVVASATRNLAELVVAKPLEEQAFRNAVRAFRESLRDRRQGANG